MLTAQLPSSWSDTNSNQSKCVSLLVTVFTAHGAHAGAGVALAHLALGDEVGALGRKDRPVPSVGRSASGSHVR